VERIVVTGVSGAVGRRLLVLLDDGREREVVGLDRRPPRQRPPWFSWRLVELADAAVEPVLADALTGADALVHLAFDTEPRLSAADTEAANVDGTRRLLAAAASAGVRRVVVLSSVSVYGAWPGNPVPLPEGTPLRPNTDLVPAQQRAEVERLVGAWRAEHPGVAVAVLRAALTTAPTVDPDVAALVHRAVRPPRGLDLPARQLVHVDDVASAVLVALDRGLDGTFDVAPDDWDAPIPAPRRRGGVARVAIPPAMRPLASHPIVVSNARLRAEGWAPRFGSAVAAAVVPAPARSRRAGPVVAALAALAGVLVARRLCRR
jgi:UDP-glucose 4-epimerase